MLARIPVPPYHPAVYARGARGHMALAALSADEQRIVLLQLCNALEPRVAVAFSSVSHGLWASTHALLQQLRDDHEAATALCHKVGMRSCKELREVGHLSLYAKLSSANLFATSPSPQGLSGAELATLGSLGSVLPALEKLRLIETYGASGPDGVQRLADGLGAGALPAVTELRLARMHIGDAGASALAAALDRGVMPRLRVLSLQNNALGDAGLVALAPALRRRPALVHLTLGNNLLGDEGLAALVMPWLPAGAPPPPTGGLAKLKQLGLWFNQVTYAGYATLAAALDGGAMPALRDLDLIAMGGSPVAQVGLYEALAKSRPLLTVSVTPWD